MCFRNDFARSLALINEVGKRMDAAALTPVHVELLKQLDDPTENSPDMFELKMIKEVETSCRDLGDRVFYMQVINNMCLIFAFYSIFKLYFTCIDFGEKCC
jgi:hypothetical protein